jgi:Tol biopolymer transport system component/tRNA A-37 threonylcarbamoyl transferase component Bud32
MTAADLDRLGPALADRYRLERELGQGGMATVYLAQDLKHDRRVAIKVLKPELAAVIGAERFLREIKTIATLQHPHILGLIDSGEVNGTAYYVMPFVEGESLRDRLVREKQLPIADAVRLATEVAAALDYAHRHGVIHRDIKPENVLLHDGSALVADFGIALAVSSAGGGSRMTETGMSLGTPHYMSPEQAMGQREITARSDVYALGAMTYEMLVGDPPFTGSTAQAIVAKAMTEKPASLQRQRERVPDAVEDAVLTALEKLPADRFASAAEFAAALRGDGAVGTRVGRSTARTRAARSPGRWAALAGAVLALVATGFALGGLSHGRSQIAPATFVQRTFRDEAIFNARFAPDGKTMVYSAASESPAPALFVIRPDYPEPAPLGLADTHLLAISSKAELAVLVRAAFVRHRLFQGTLARVPLGGGAPREIIDSVREADWSPDGTALAIIHDANGRDRLEYPVGTVLYEVSGYLSDPRVSPDGKHVAFAEHPFRWDDRGVVRIVDRAGKPTAVSREFVALEGLAWRPGSDEVWFSGYANGLLLVYGLGLEGRLRIAVSSSGSLTTQDISPAGQLLVTRDDAPYRLMLQAPGAKRDVDVSWLDASFNPRVSHDGSLLAFTNGGMDGGDNYSVLLQRTGGGQVARLGEGASSGFSPDGKWLLGSVPSTPPRVVLYPTGAGVERRIDVGAYESIGAVDWFPDGRSLLVCGSRKGEASRCYRTPLSGGSGLPVTPPGTAAGLVSPDAREVVAVSQAFGYRRYPLAGGDGMAIPGLSAHDQVIRWSPDGRALFVQPTLSQTVERLELTTGHREPLLTLGSTQGRFTPIGWISMADDPHVYAYVAMPYLSQLFTVDGAR